MDSSMVRYLLIFLIGSLVGDIIGYRRARKRFKKIGDSYEDILKDYRKLIKALSIEIVEKAKSKIEVKD